MNSLDARINARAGLVGGREITPARLTRRLYRGRVACRHCGGGMSYRAFFARFCGPSCQREYLSKKIH